MLKVLVAFTAVTAVLSARADWIYAAAAKDGRSLRLLSNTVTFLPAPGGRIAAGTVVMQMSAKATPIRVPVTVSGCDGDRKRLVWYGDDLTGAKVWSTRGGRLVDQVGQSVCYDASNTAEPADARRAAELAAAQPSPAAAKFFGFGQSAAEILREREETNAVLAEAYAAAEERQRRADAAVLRANAAAAALVPRTININVTTRP
jgi:hypothetical protein